MNPIFQALNSGYSPDKVLEYLSKALPHLGGSIYKAKSAGYTVKQILGFLAKTSSERDTKGMSDPEIRAMNSRTEGEMVKNALTMTAGALGTAVLGRAAAGAIAPHLPALSNRGTPNAPGTSHMPSTKSSLTPQAPQQTMQSSPLPNMQSAPPSGANPVLSSPQRPPISNPNISPQPVKTINAKEILDSSDLTKQVQTLLEKGNDSNQVGGYFRHFNKNIVEKIEKETGKPFEDIISEYKEQIPKKTEEQDLSKIGEMGKGITDNFYNGIFDSLKNKKDTFSGVKDPLIAKAKPLYEKGLIKSPEDLRDFANGKLKEQSFSEPEEIEETVFTPSGKGIIKEISGDNALIEEDGELKQHKLDKVIESPLPEKDLAELHEDLLKGIEKHTGRQNSRNVEYAGYDPENKELLYKPHGSDRTYLYDDISPEDADALTNLLTLRKSTGSNFVGAWEAGTESPIGAAMYQLIRKLQAERGGKGNEYKSKFETIYDVLEPSKEMLKAKHAEKKRKEREDKPKKAKKPRAS